MKVQGGIVFDFSRSCWHRFCSGLSPKSLILLIIFIRLSAGEYGRASGSAVRTCTSIKGRRTSSCTAFLSAPTLRTLSQDLKLPLQRWQGRQGSSKPVNQRNTMLQRRLPDDVKACAPGLPPSQRTLAGTPQVKPGRAWPFRAALRVLETVPATPAQHSTRPVTDVSCSFVT